MPTTRANWIYLFHGEDELSSHEAVQGLVARMKDSPMWEYNVASFDGEKLALPELFGTCQTVPFLGEKRLVVVSNLVSKLGESGRGQGRDEQKQERAPRGSKKAVLDALLAFLPSVPDFCRLVFLEDQLIPERDPVLRAIAGLGGIVRVHRLGEATLLGWIRNRVAHAGCRMTVDAMEELAAAVGPNARLLDSEMVKLSTYCGDRQVTVEDVRALVANARRANIFAMVDAIGLRRPETAMRELRKLLSEGDHPLRVTAMVQRQFRLLVQVKELSGQRMSPDEVAQQASVSPRAVPGLQRQALNFSFEQLEAAYRRLLEFDLEVKTSARDPEAALELLAMDLMEATSAG